MGDINEQKEVYTNQRERGQARIWGAGQSNKMVILKGSQSILESLPYASYHGQKKISECG